MKILIADKFEQSGIDGLRRRWAATWSTSRTSRTTRSPRRWHRAAPQVLVVRSTQVTEADARAGQLSLIVRAGAGVNTIDVAGASRRGIYVSNCPGKNAVAVAELAFALMLALDRRIPDNVDELRAGQVEQEGVFEGTGTLRPHARADRLRQHRPGSGAARARLRHAGRWSGAGGSPATPTRAGRPSSELGIEVVGSAGRGRGSCRHHQHSSRADQGHARLRRRRRAAARAAGRDADQHRAGRGARLRGARRRGPREGAARRARRVCQRAEPAPKARFDDPILALPNVIGTHHIGASTDQAQEAIAAETVRIVRTFVETGRVPNVVNLAKQTPATHMLVVRHRDKPGVLAHVFERLRAANLNVQETENIIFEGAHAAVARINLDGEPAPETRRGDSVGQSPMCSICSL